MPGRLVSKVWQWDPTIYAPAKYQRACKYDAFIPQPLANLTFALDSTLAGLISEAEHAIRTLNDLGGSSLDPLARLLLRTESIASSKVEGMQLGVRDLARAEARVESGGKAGPTALEVLSNIDAMVLAIEDATTVEGFSIDQVTAIHSRLMERAENRHIAGKVRTRQNWIGGNDYNACGADFVPPPPEEVPALLDDLCQAINDNIHSPLVQAALVHAQFETIHPFDDGNGRTGRALIHVVLRKRNVAPHYVPPISVAIAGTKSRYVDGLTRFRGEEVASWIEYFAGAAARSAFLAKAYVAKVEELKASWIERLKSRPNAPRAGATVWSVVDALPAHPMITVSVAAERTGRSKPSVNQAFEELQNAGILLPLSQARMNRTWEVAGLLDLITALESGEPPTD